MNKDYLLRALALAKTRRGFCTPNPAVGAVVVKDSCIISEGEHYQAGAPHAEAAALQALSSEFIEGATLYVTLEPCCHFGRTPPCTDLIIERKIAKVIYAYEDPNPTVKGQGIAQLKEAGIKCEHYPLPEINDFYQSYTFWQKNKIPVFHAKLALSADEKIAGIEGNPAAITGELTREFTHEQRLHADAILTTAKTIQCDDPQLNVRLNGKTIAKPIYILDRELSLSPDAQILQTAERLTLFHRNDLDPNHVQEWKRRNLQCLCVSTPNNLLDLIRISQLIGDDGMHDVWVEAGAQAFIQFIQTGLAKKVYLYHSPKIIGETGTSANLPKDLLQTFTKEKSFTLGEDRIEIYTHCTQDLTSIK